MIHQFRFVLVPLCALALTAAWCIRGPEPAPGAAPGAGTSSESAGGPYLVPRAGCAPYAPPGEYLLDHAIIRDDSGLYHLFAIHQPVGKEWWMGPYGASLHHAVSRDLCRWEPRGNILPAGDGEVTDAVWDGRHIWAPHVIRHEGTYYLFYTGVRYTYTPGPDGKPVPRPIQAIGLATSTDLDHWTKSPANPVFRPTHPDIRYDEQAGEADARDPMVFRDGKSGRFLLYYTARDRAGHGVVAAALSTDLVHWQDLGPVLRLPSPVGANGAPWMPESAFVLERDGRYYLFFTVKYGPGPADHSMRYAVSDDPLRGWQLAEPVDSPRHLFADQRSVAIIGEPVEVDGEVQLSLITAPSFEDHYYRRASGVVVDQLVIGRWPRQVGALFWYWFDCSANPATPTGRNCDYRKFPYHPPGTADDVPTPVDPRNPEWYRREVQDLVYAGVQIVFPVSMGDPPISDGRPPEGPRWPKEPEFPYGDPPGYYPKQSWLLGPGGLTDAIRDLRAPLRVGLLDDMTSQVAEWNDEADDGKPNGTNYCFIREDPESGRPRQNKLVDGQWRLCEPIRPLPIPSADAYRLTYDHKIKPYFSALPRDLWATHDGRPPAEGGRPLILVFPPAGGDPEVIRWTKPRDEALREYFAELKRRFQADFGIEPFIVPETFFARPDPPDGRPAEGADAFWSWNPIAGSRVTTRGYTVAAIGPGENSALINTFNQYHPTPRNEIERDGRRITGAEDLRLAYAFESAWRSDLLLVLSWNELLEGHGINRAVDYPANTPGQYLKPSFYIESLRRLLGLPLDREPPRITGLNVRETGATLRVDVAAEDDRSGVERVDLFLVRPTGAALADRSRWERLGVLSRGAGSLNLPRSRFASGDYLLIAEATDVAGNVCQYAPGDRASCGRSSALSLR